MIEEKLELLTIPMQKGNQGKKWRTWKSQKKCFVLTQFARPLLQCAARAKGGLNDTYSQECFVYDVYSGHRVIFGSDWCWSNFLFFFFFFSEWLRGCFHFHTTHILHPQTLSARAVWSHVIETTLLLAYIASAISSGPDEVVSTSNSSSHQATRPNHQLPFCTSKPCGRRMYVQGLQ